MPWYQIESICPDYDVLEYQQLLLSLRVIVILGIFGVQVRVFDNIFSIWMITILITYIQ